VEGNYNTRSGEIDLILTDGDDVVFVKVRQRTSSRFGTPAETVNKQQYQRPQKTQHSIYSELTRITVHLVDLMSSLLRMIVRTPLSIGSRMCFKT
jgi:Holliday junction resolvase-like predicted endonuclease